MNKKVIQIQAQDGRSLTGTLYEPNNSKNCALLINSAMAVKRQFYDAYATHMASLGFTVLTYDYRGIGDSKQGPTVNDDADMQSWGELDTVAAIDTLESLSPQANIYAVAHSAGGQVFGLAKNNHKVKGLICKGSQSGYWRWWPFPHQLILVLFWYAIMPGLTSIFSYFPGSRIGLAGVDLPPKVAKQWSYWGRHVDYIVDEQKQPIRCSFNAFKGHILAHFANDDWLAPQKSVEALMGFYTSAAVTLVSLVPSSFGLKSIGHFGYFKHSHQSLWQQDAEWFLSQEIAASSLAGGV